MAEKAGGDGGDGGGEVEERGQRVPREARRARTGTGVDKETPKGKRVGSNSPNLLTTFNSLAI